VGPSLKMVRFTAHTDGNVLHRSLECSVSFLTLKGQRSRSKCRNRFLAVTLPQMVGFTSDKDQNVPVGVVCLLFLL